MTTTSSSEALAPCKARHGVWTPWASVLCVECDYAALKESTRSQHYAKHLAAVAKMDRAAEVECPEGDLLAACDNCHCPCWARKDVALLQQVGYKTSDLDWEGPFGWELEQTGGMCAALVFSTADDREIVVTAMDGDLFVGEYAKVGDDEERWMDPIRTWQSPSLYVSDESGSAMKTTSELAILVEECARKVVALVHSPGGAS